MLACQIHKPIAWALFDSRSSVISNCTAKEFQTYTELLSIPTFEDILIFKYDSHIELYITVHKTINTIEKTHSLFTLYEVLGQIEDVDYENISNSLRSYQNHNSLKIICTLHGINP